MAAMTVASVRPALAARTRPAQAGFSGVRPAGLVRPAPKMTVAPKTVRPARRAAVETKAVMEVAQIAGEAGEIAGTAGVMFVCTLVGLAIGFVFLRVESLVEEGKI